MKGFHTVFHSTLRVLVMMVGELDYGTTFVQTMETRNSSNQKWNSHWEKNPFPPVAFFFSFLCLFLLTIALVNLLVGLAVGDTEKIRKLATIQRLELQIEYHIEVEGSYPAFITKYFYERDYVEKPNKHSIYHRVMEWLQARYAAATPEPVFEENKPTEHAELREGMMKNKKRIKSIVTMLEAQNKLLRSMALSINPNLELPEDPEEASWRKDDTDDYDGGYQPSLETVKKLSEDPTDDTGVDFSTGNKASTHSIFDSDL